MSNEQQYLIEQAIATLKFLHEGATRHAKTLEGRYTLRDVKFDFEENCFEANYSQYVGCGDYEYKTEYITLTEAASA